MDNRHIILIEWLAPSSGSTNRVEYYYTTSCHINNSSTRYNNNF